MVGASPSSRARDYPGCKSREVWCHRGRSLELGGRLDQRHSLGTSSSMYVLTKSQGMEAFCALLSMYVVCGCVCVGVWVCVVGAVCEVGLCACMWLGAGGWHRITGIRRKRVPFHQLWGVGLPFLLPPTFCLERLCHLQSHRAAVRQPTSPSLSSGPGWRPPSEAGKAREGRPASSPQRTPFLSPKASGDGEGVLSTCPGP